MDPVAVKGLIERHFAYARTDPERGHDMYEPDAVLEFPQSGERFEGVENMREWRGGYPASTAVTFGEVRGAGELWVVELEITYDDGPRNFGVSILELRGERIARETIYVAEGFDPPDFRAEWRSD